MGAGASALSPEAITAAASAAGGVVVAAVHPVAASPRARRLGAAAATALCVRLAAAVRDATKQRISAADVPSSDRNSAVLHPGGGEPPAAPTTGVEFTIVSAELVGRAPTDLVPLYERELTAAPRGEVLPAVLGGSVTVHRIPLSVAQELCAAMDPYA